VSARRRPEDRPAGGGTAADSSAAAGGGTAGGDARLERGRITRREVLGDDHVDRAEAATTPFSAPFQEYLTGAAWADVWPRPGLDRRTRSAITLAILTALRAEGEIAMHVRAALRNGLTPPEIAEVILHTAPYAGIPAANAAFAIAGRTLADDGVSLAPGGGTTDADSKQRGAPKARAGGKSGRTRASRKGASR
jgi:4-carboxymuconolactone decarboxylase